MTNVNCLALTLAGTVRLTDFRHHTRNQSYSILYNQTIVYLQVGALHYYLEMMSTAPSPRKRKRRPSDANDPGLLSLELPSLPVTQVGPALGVYGRFYPRAHFLS